MKLPNIKYLTIFLLSPTVFWLVTVLYAFLDNFMLIEVIIELAKIYTCVYFLISTYIIYHFIKHREEILKSSEKEKYHLLFGLYGSFATVLFSILLLTPYLESILIIPKGTLFLALVSEVMSLFLFASIVAFIYVYDIIFFNNDNDKKNEVDLPGF